MKQKAGYFIRNIKDLDYEDLPIPSSILLPYYHKYNLFHITKHYAIAISGTYDLWYWGQLPNAHILNNNKTLNTAITTSNEDMNEELSSNDSMNNSRNSSNSMIKCNAKAIYMYNEESNDGLTRYFNASPKKLILNWHDNKIIKVACANEYCLILTDNGNVYSWGSDPNHYGILGQNHITYHEKPQLVNLLSNNNLFIVDISITDQYAAAISVLGKVYLWGNYGLFHQKDITFMNEDKSLIELNDSENKYSKVEAALGLLLLINYDGKFMYYGNFDYDWKNGCGMPKLRIHQILQNNSFLSMSCTKTDNIVVSLLEKNGTIHLIFGENLVYSLEEIESLNFHSHQVTKNALRVIARDKNNEKSYLLEWEIQDDNSLSNGLVFEIDPKYSNNFELSNSTMNYVIPFVHNEPSNILINNSIRSDRHKNLLNNSNSIFEDSNASYTSHETNKCNSYNVVTASELGVITKLIRPTFSLIQKKSIPSEFSTYRQSYDMINKSLKLITNDQAYDQSQNPECISMINLNDVSINLKLLSLNERHFKNNNGDNDDDYRDDKSFSFDVKGRRRDYDIDEIDTGIMNSVDTNMISIPTNRSNIKKHKNGEYTNAITVDTCANRNYATCDSTIRTAKNSSPMNMPINIDVPYTQLQFTEAKSVTDFCEMDNSQNLQAASLDSKILNWSSNREALQYQGLYSQSKDLVGNEYFISRTPNPNIQKEEKQGFFIIRSPANQFQPPIYSAMNDSSEHEYPNQSNLNTTSEGFNTKITLNTIMPLNCQLNPYQNPNPLIINNIEINNVKHGLSYPNNLSCTNNISPLQSADKEKNMFLHSKNMQNNQMYGIRQEDIINDINTACLEEEPINSKNSYLSKRLTESNTNRMPSYDQNPLAKCLADINRSMLSKSYNNLNENEGTTHDHDLPSSKGNSQKTKNTYLSFSQSPLSKKAKNAHLKSRNHPLQLTSKSKKMKQFSSNCKYNTNNKSPLRPASPLNHSLAAASSSRNSSEYFEKKLWVKKLKSTFEKHYNTTFTLLNAIKDGMGASGSKNSLSNRFTTELGSISGFRNIYQTQRSGAITDKTNSKIFEFSNCKTEDKENIQITENNENQMKNSPSFNPSFDLPFKMEEIAVINPFEITSDIKKTAKIMCNFSRFVNIFCLIQGDRLQAGFYEIYFTSIRKKYFNNQGNLLKFYKLIGLANKCNTNIMNYAFNKIKLHGMIIQLSLNRTTTIANYPLKQENLKILNDILTKILTVSSIRNVQYCFNKIKIKYKNYNNNIKSYNKMVYCIQKIIKKYLSHGFKMINHNNYSKFMQNQNKKLSGFFFFLSLNKIFQKRIAKTFIYLHSTSKEKHNQSIAKRNTKFETNQYMDKPRANYRVCHMPTPSFNKELIKQIFPIEKYSLILEKAITKLVKIDQTHKIRIKWSRWEKKTLLYRAIKLGLNKLFKILKLNIQSKFKKFLNDLTNIHTLSANKNHYFMLSYRQKLINTRPNSRYHSYKSFNGLHNSLYDSMNIKDKVIILKNIIDKFRIKYKKKAAFLGLLRHSNEILDQYLKIKAKINESYYEKRIEKLSSTLNKCIKDRLMESIFLIMKYSYERFLNYYDEVMNNQQQADDFRILTNTYSKNLLQLAQSQLVIFQS